LVDGLASLAEEGRGKQRYARVRRTQPTTPRSPNEDLLLRQIPKGRETR